MWDVTDIEIYLSVSENILVLSKNIRWDDMNQIEQQTVTCHYGFLRQEELFVPQVCGATVSYHVR